MTEREVSSERLPERCPHCDLQWLYNPPAIVAGTDKVRCIECKTVFVPSVSSERVSEERLKEMLAGLDGVTPEPWNYSRGESYVSGFYGSANVRQVAVKPAGNLTNKNADLSHIARCGPGTMRAILSELLALRSSVKTVGEEARAIIANPAGSLWNYGTKPTRLDEAKWQGMKEAAEMILAHLSALPAPTTQGAPSEVTEEPKGMDSAPRDKAIVVWWPIVAIDEETGDLTDTEVDGRWLVTEWNGDCWLEPDVLNALNSMAFDDDCEYARHPKCWLSLPPVRLTAALKGDR